MCRFSDRSRPRYRLSGPFYFSPFLGFDFADSMGAISLSKRATFRSWDQALGILDVNECLILSLIVWWARLPLLSVSSFHWTSRLIKSTFVRYSSTRLNYEKKKHQWSTKPIQQEGRVVETILCISSSGISSSSTISYEKQRGTSLPFSSPELNQVKIDWSVGMRLS